VTAPIRSDQPWLAPFLALAAMWGASFLCIKVALDDLDPIGIVLGRILLGTVTLLALLAVRRERLPRGGVWVHLAVLAVIGNALPFAGFAYGETHVSSVLAGIYNAATPLFTLVIAMAVLPDERPTRQRLLGLTIGFVGVVIVLGPWRGLGGGALAGQLMCLGAALSYAVAFPYQRRFLAGRPESGAVLAAGQLLCATVIAAVLAPAVGDAPDGLGLDTVASLLVLGALGTGVAYVLNYVVVRRAGATTAATVTYVIPVVATVLGVVVLAEPLAWNQPVGGLVVLGGLALAQGALRVGRRRAALAD
jgi:drug/metabolite transporter (DMT)-like permease